MWHTGQDTCVSLRHTEISAPLRASADGRSFSVGCDLVDSTRGYSCGVPQQRLPKDILDGVGGWQIVVDLRMRMRGQYLHNVLLESFWFANQESEGGSRSTPERRRRHAMGSTIRQSLQETLPCQGVENILALLFARGSAGGSPGPSAVEGRVSCVAAAAAHSWCEPWASPSRWQWNPVASDRWEWPVPHP